MGPRTCWPCWRRREQHCGDRERLCNWFCGFGESSRCSGRSASESTVLEWTSSADGFSVACCLAPWCSMSSWRWRWSCGVDHEGSGDASEEPGTVWVVLGATSKVVGSSPLAIHSLWANSSSWTVTRSTLLVMVSSWTTPSLPQKRSPCARSQFTATPQQKGTCMVSSPTTGITQGSVTGHKDVFTDSAGFDVDSDAATRPYRQRERPVLVSNVLVWCVDRFTREDAVAYGHPIVFMATASLKRTSRSRGVSDSTRKSAHTHLSCALLLRSVCSVVCTCNWPSSLLSLAQVALKIVRNHQQATHAHPHILYWHSHVWQGQKLDRVSETCTALERKLHGHCLAGF